jgi:hypothetical protein
MSERQHNALTTSSLLLRTSSRVSSPISSEPSRATTAPEDLPVEVRYTCSKLRELAKMFAKDCKGPITVYYRPVIDHRRDSRLLGFSMLVVQNEPPCKDARR